VAARSEAGDDQRDERTYFDERQRNLDDAPGPRPQGRSRGERSHDDRDPFRIAIPEQIDQNRES
jgi:hypothetical protein